MSLSTKNGRAAILGVLPYATGSITIEDTAHLLIQYRIDLEVLAPIEMLSGNSWIRQFRYRNSAINISTIDEASAINTSEKQKSNIDITLTKTSTI